MQEARKWLTSADLNCLERASLDVFDEDEDIAQVLAAYRGFERSLRQSLAQLRGAKALQAEPLQLAKVKALLSEGNPLEKEKKLLLARWQYIEELEVGHFFDIEFIILYYLKLQLLEQLFSFDKEKGQKIFDGLCEVA